MAKAVLQVAILVFNNDLKFKNCNCSYTSRYAKLCYLLLIIIGFLLIEYKREESNRWNINFVLVDGSPGA